jgi:hypothetical protein
VLAVAATGPGGDHVGVHLLGVAGYLSCRVADPDRGDGLAVDPVGDGLERLVGLFLERPVNVVV